MSDTLVQPDSRVPIPYNEYVELSESPPLSFGPEVKDISVSRMGPTLISNLGAQSEVSHMEFVRLNTTIPVPCPRAIEGNHNFFLLDFIAGRRLKGLWEDLSIWSKFRVVCNLRSYF